MYKVQKITIPPYCTIRLVMAGGVTHLSFSPDGNYLYSGARKDSDILCWDMRNPGQILNIYKRKVETNQRIYFDIDKDWKYLFSGSNDKLVNIWKINNDINNDLESEPPLYSFQAHDDCVNGVSIHPTLPILATSSGQRKFKQDYLTSSDEETNSNNKISNINRENSLKIWHLNQMLN